MSSNTKVGIATGGARGMGHACARQMIETVDVLFVVDRDGDGAKQVAETLSTSSTKAVPVTLDVTDRSGVRSFAEAVAAEGKLRAVVHAAGISPTMADWESVVRVDLVGTALLVDALTPLVVPGTAMVCFASMAAQLAADAIAAEVDAVPDELGYYHPNPPSSTRPSTTTCSSGSGARPAR